MIENRLTGSSVRIEEAAFAACGHRHADCGGQSRAERAGGDLHTVGVADLRVAGSQGAPLAQRLEIVEFEAVAAEVELDVLGQAGVTGREDEAVTADPLRVRRVVDHRMLVEVVGDRSQAHRRAGMTVAGLLHGVGSEQAGSVDCSAVRSEPGQGAHVSESILLINGNPPPTLPAEMSCAEPRRPPFGTG